MANVVGERFQITIDRVVRERLGIEPGDFAVERVEDGRLVVEFMPRPHDRSLRGILKRAEVPPATTDSAAEKEAAWVARGGEVTAALEADRARHGRRGRAKGG
jgi:bifunctional DNA-binding transcriptional regulator/antitoxin component of YhaV-PrlF toxin-antitoxin module